MESSWGANFENFRQIEISDKKLKIIIFLIFFEKIQDRKANFLLTKTATFIVWNRPGVQILKNFRKHEISKKSPKSGVSSRIYFIAL